MRAIVPAWRSNSASHNWFNELDQIFENLIEHPVRKNGAIAWDVEESDKFILFSFDLPGLEEKDFNIEVKESVLQISGERKRTFIGEGTRQFRGRSFGAFSQSFRLPKNIDQDSIEADYTNGELKVLIPKSEASQPRKVEVKSKRGSYLTDLLKSKKDD